MKKRVLDLESFHEKLTKPVEFNQRADFGCPTNSKCKTILQKFELKLGTSFRNQQYQEHKIQYRLH